MEDILTELLSTVAVSGYEGFGTTSTQIAKIAEGFSGTTIEKDKAGNVLVLKGKGPKTMLFDAHLDEVGFVVSKVFPDGSVQVTPLGDIDPLQVKGSFLEVYDKNSRIAGGILHENFILELEAGSQMSIRVGDWCAFRRSLTREEFFFMGPALDNRVGCALLLGLLRDVEPQGFTFAALFSVQHEQGGFIGIHDWIHNLSPEEVVIIDSAYAFPDGNSDWTIPVMSEGPALQLLGKNFISNGPLISRIRDCATRHSLPIQFEIPDGASGGTNASRVTSRIPFAALNIPVLAQHTDHSRASFVDILTAQKLLASFLEEAE